MVTPYLFLIVTLCALVLPWAAAAESRCRARTIRSAVVGTVVWDGPLAFLVFGASVMGAWGDMGKVALVMVGWVGIGTTLLWLPVFTLARRRSVDP